MAETTRSSLRPIDYGYLVGYCLVVSLFALWFHRSLTIHETIGCVNIREMLQSGDWLVPTLGGWPWLERPPLPFWITMPLVATLGDAAWVFRLAPLLVAIPCVLMTAWMAGLWFGRATGLIAGATLATIQEFRHYATAPESDMFLCGLVTLGMCLVAYLEFCRRPAEGETGFWLGRRPWALLIFFVVLGLTNLTKGLIFGDLFLLLPLAVFLLLDRNRWALLRRYLWLPGWLTFALVGSAWAVAVYLRHPDVLDLWKHDYLGRYNQGYMREPLWYYLAHLPLILLPWTLVAALGLAVTARRAFAPEASAERFLWCWALVPVVFFSLPQGKHHHYLLHLMPAWAMLSAVGLVRLWQWLPTWTFLHRPWPLLGTVGVAGLVVLWVAGKPLGALHLPALIAWPVVVLAYWWILSRPRLEVAAPALFALLVPAHWACHALVPLLNDRYAGDHALVAEVDRFPRDKAPLFIMDDCTPLGGSWFLFHLQQPARLLRNPTHLLREDVPDESYVLMRRCTAEKAAQFAYISLVKESACSKDEQGQEAFRMGLYHVTVLPHLARVSPVPLSPMQATGRSFGPFLTSEPGLRQLTAAPATETLPGVGFMPPGLLTPGSDPARQ